jgi:hypothetical protein
MQAIARWGRRNVADDQPSRKAHLPPGAKVAMSGSWVTSTMVMPSRLSAVEQRHDFLAGMAVEVAGRFVGEDQLRRVDQRAGNRHALLLAARNAAGQRCGVIAEADPASIPRARRLAARALDAGIDQRQGDVVF